MAVVKEIPFGVHGGVVRFHDDYIVSKDEANNILERLVDILQPILAAEEIKKREDAEKCTTPPAPDVAQI